MKRNPWIPVILATAFILILTSIPKVPTPPKTIHYLDKIAHFVIYFIWGYSLSFLWKSRKKRPRFLMFLFVVSLFLFPAFDELHQYLIPGRNPSFFDWIFDFAGASIAFSIFTRIPGRRRL